MISDIYVLNQDDNLNYILKEAEKVAAYGELDKKNAMRLRLLAEEMVSLIPKLLEMAEGKFWIENKDAEFELHVSLEADTADYDQKKKILELSKTGKNASYRGIMGKVFYAFEKMMDFYAEYGNPAPGTDPSFFSGGVLVDTSVYSTAWSLNEYQKYVKRNGDESEEAMDELEKSIIANIADDVIVGIKGNKIDIVIKKNFA